MKSPKKNKKGGLTGGIIAGIGALIILVVIILVMVSTVRDADLIAKDSIDTFTVLNETITFDSVNTAQTLSASSYDWVTSCNAITYIANQSILGASLATGNITQTGCSVINASDFTEAGTGNNGTMCVSYTWTRTVATSKNTAGNMTTNLSAGINKVALQVPTILVIAVIVLLIGIIVFLVNRARPFFNQGGGSSL